MTGGKRWFAVGLVLGLTLAPWAALAGPTDSLRAGQRAYARGRYKQVVKLVRPLLHPTIRLANQAQVLNAHRLLALSYLFLKDRAAAEKQLMALLSLQPEFQLDPVVDPVAAVQFLDEIKRRNAQRIAMIKERERLEREKRLAEDRRRKLEQKRLALERLMKQPTVERLVERRFLWLNFVPFGAGQFQNGHRTKGYVLLSSQATLAAASLGLALGLRVAYPDGKVPADQWDTAQGLSAAQVITGALFLAVATYGVVDALVYYEPVTVTLRPVPRTSKPAKASPATSIFFAPAVAPGSAGVGLGLTF